MIKLDRSIFFSWLVVTILLCATLLMTQCERKQVSQKLVEYAEIHERFSPETYNDATKVDPQGIAQLILELESLGRSPEKPIPQSQDKIDCETYKFDPHDTPNVTFSVYFNFDGMGRRPDLEVATQKMSECLLHQGLPRNSEIVITGYSDKQGTYLHNENLSKARAMTIMELLRSHIPVTVPMKFELGSESNCFDPRIKQDFIGEEFKEPLCRKVEVKLKTKQ